MTPVSQAGLRAAIRALGLSMLPLEVHSSLRSFGWVDGGADAVIDALLVEGCTLLVPTFSDVYFVHPLPHQRPGRNATNYDRTLPPAPGADRTFTPDSNEIDVRDMGIVPATVLRRSGRIRGNHPVMSFSAIGPLAHDIIDGQAPQAVYAPLAALVEHGGWVVMMGVGLTEMTFLHYAEQLAGRTPFVRWANGLDGTPMEVQYGGCSNGFEAFTPVLAHLEQRATAGQSLWRAYPARKALDAAINAIQKDPYITYCADRCGRCADAIAGGPILA